MSRESPQTPLASWKLVIIGVLILVVAVILVQRSDHRGPISEHDRRKYYGDAFIINDAPFCCIYVGLDTNETALFDTNFWHFADQHDIRKPKKHYRAYSGPPLVTCKSDHVSVFAHSIPTADLVSRRERFGDPLPGEQLSAQGAIWMNAYWPTNAGRITKDGLEVLAPLTGTIRMAPNDTNYPLQDFKQLSEALAATIQSAFPDRAVRVVSFDGGSY